MKTNKLLNIVLTLLVGIAIFSCVEDDDYSIPESLGNEENAGLQEILDSVATYQSWSMIDMADLKSMYNGQNQLIESNLVVKGYVSSSDQTGNFYKEFYLQDDPTNPTAGMGVMINQTDTYNQFNQGREVYIYLKGLYLGENDSDVVSVGDVDGEYMTEVAAAVAPDHFFRSSTTMEITPLELMPSEINESHFGIYATVSNVQFPAEFLGRTYHNPNNDYDTTYPISSCEDGSEILLYTSSFANFSQIPLPELRGAISGVITQNYGGYDTVLVLNTPEDVDFTSDRCDPVFEETFNSAIDNTELNIAGWINYAEAGSELWTEQVYSGNGYAEFNPYSSGDSSNIGWLITPGIDLDSQDGEILTFETEHAYPDSGHDPLSVLISTDFDGTEAGISTATWTELTFNVSYIVNYGTWYNFTPSGSIDISNYTGTAYIAFRYTGSDSANQNMTLHVENVRVSVP